ncbi:MAG: hypothetical protein HYS27_03265 [Deltaproteobacteria bacterium]|nr:hypothetical protein [Deltaproteobacteria bacterium]
MTELSFLPEAAVEAMRGAVEVLQVPAVVPYLILEPGGTPLEALAFFPTLGPHGTLVVLRDRDEIRRHDRAVVSYARANDIDYSLFFGITPGENALRMLKDFLEERGFVLPQY